ncbi:unnamed protein product [Auanema sp. JU1783]|nr:unnamed protein product [Auanema sp. JU1783]
MLQPSWPLLFIYYSFIFSHVTIGFVAQKKVLKPVLSETSKRQTSDDISYDSLSLIPNQGERGDPHGRLGAWIRVNARHHIPIKYPRTRLDVHVSAGLYQIVDLDQRNNLATVSAYFDVWWFDEFLQWNTTQYSGIGRIFVPLKWIWKPEFYMYHSVIGRVPDFPNDASAELRFDGRVRIRVLKEGLFCVFAGRNEAF